MIFSNMGEIHARLFDHRPVIQQEINLFIREFEEKRNDRELKNLKSSLDVCHQLSNDSLPGLTGNLATLLPQISNTLTAANDISTAILEKNASKQEDWLKSQQAERTAQWTAFMECMCAKSAAVDEEFQADVRLSEQYYIQLEEKLKLTPSPQS